MPIVLAHVSQEIDKHCRQAIVDNHRWVNSWSDKVWADPCVHGDLGEQIDKTQLLLDASFQSKLKRVRTLPLKKDQFCFTHGCHCRSRKATDIDFTGLPCQENSKCNTKRKFLQGRFANLYATWAHRHETLRTPLAILENTEEPFSLV